MIHNTKQFIPMETHFKYDVEVEKSLLEGVLYYGKELILTEDFIIGIIESNIKFLPVAIPRKEIACFVFFCRSAVTSQYHRVEMGILECQLYSGKSVELIIGQGAKMNRVLKVFNYYQIEWKKEETIYE